jgi:hypothetical protein
VIILERLAKLRIRGTTFLSDKKGGVIATVCMGGGRWLFLTALSIKKGIHRRERVIKVLVSPRERKIRKRVTFRATPVHIAARSDLRHQPLKWKPAPTIPWRVLHGLSPRLPPVDHKQTETACSKSATI